MRQYEDEVPEENIVEADEIVLEESEEVSSEYEGPETPPPASKSLPKRVLAFSSQKLLNLFSKCKRGSVDGTFKSSCKLWKQQFIFMLKYKEHWIPVVWGWLPDKSEESYKVFFHLLLEKLEELEIEFNLVEVIVDFELNIHKAIDEMMPAVRILGCFFHLSKAFQKKVTKNNMKTLYDEDIEFQRFIKKSVALSHLPLEDLETGLDWLKENVHFENSKIESFKNDFLKYIETYWINGCFPPYTWSTWGRKDDWTNNNQEGFNSKMNKELKQKHTSPGILLCFIKKQLKIAEFKLPKLKLLFRVPENLLNRKDKQTKEKI